MTGVGNLATVQQQGCPPARGGDSAWGDLQEPAWPWRALTGDWPVSCRLVSGQRGRQRHAGQPGLRDPELAAAHGAPTRRGAAKRLCRRRRGCGRRASAGPRSPRTRPPSWETAPRPEGVGVGACSVFGHLRQSPGCQAPRILCLPGCSPPRHTPQPGRRVCASLVIPKCRRNGQAQWSMREALGCGAWPRSEGRFPARVGDAGGCRGPVTRGEPGPHPP